MIKILVLLICTGLAYKFFSSPVLKISDYNVEFKYQIEYTGNANSSDALPLVIGLHGNGDKTDNFYQSFLSFTHVPARIILIQGPKSYGRGYAWPWTASEFIQYGKAFLKAVDQLKIKFPTKGNPILLGFSGGAMFAYYQALLDPDRFSSIISVSGSLRDNPRRGDESRILSDLKVFCYHGNDDKVVNINSGKHACDVVKE